MTNKEKYEQLIHASPLFSLERGTRAFKAEALKMVEYLYCYLLAVNESKYIEYGLEITQTAQKCIANFREENGIFLNYFNTSIAKEIRRASAKQQIDDMRGGIHIASEDEKYIRSIVKFLNSRGIDNPSDEHITIISQSLDLDEEYVKELIAVNNNAIAISSDTCNEDGDIVSIFDMMASSDSAEEGVYEEESILVFLSKIEECFKECQERQKPIISALMTRLICEFITEYEINVREYSFVDVQMLANFVRTGKIETQREIAEKFAKNEASLSRTMKGFIDKLKEIIR